MNITICVPDELADKLGAEADLPRRALEALVIEAYRAGRVSDAELRALLGLETRYEMDGFLKRHGVYEEFTMADLEDERESLRQVGL
jgi:hypothetical protein